VAHWWKRQLLSHAFQKSHGDHSYGVDHVLATRFSCIVGTLFLAGFFFQTTAPAQGFRIAHTSDGFTEFDFAAINDSGKVVFSGIRTVGGSEVFGVYESAGGSFRTLIEGPVSLVNVINGQQFQDGSVSAVGGAAINASGNIAINLLWQQPISTLSVAYVGETPVTPEIYLNDPNVFPLFVVPPVSAGAQITMNDQGAVFLGSTLFVPRPQVPTQVGLTQTILPAVGLDNQNRLMTYSGGFGGILSLVQCAYAKRDPFVDVLDLKPVSTNVVTTMPASIMASSFQINATGIIAYGGTAADGSGGIYLAAGAPVVTYPAPGSVAALSAEYGPATIFSINNAGEVAFFASSRTLGHSGFFHGVDPLVDKIVANGDIVAGTKLTGVGLPRLNSFSIPGHWFNNAGQIVFLANDATGTGLYVASSGITPVPPEPASTTIEWQGPGDPPPGTAPTGSFAQTNAWKPLNGDPPRVPERTQTLNDTALFDRPEAYTVDLGAQHAGRMLVVDGNVTFTSGSIQLDELSDTTPSVVIDNARLTLTFDPVSVNLGPTVSGQFGLIGANAAARVDVVTNASWVLTRVLSIGGPGEGIMTVNSGGAVTNGGAMVGGAGSGNVNIGDGGRWTTGNLAVGAGGQGFLTIQDGGQVGSDAGFIGLTGSAGTVVLQGGNENKVSRWDVASLAVGASGGAALEIKDGAVVNSIVAVIAQQVGAEGSVTVSGVNTNGESSTLSALSALTVGVAGDSEIYVLDGGRVEAGNIVLGENHVSVSVKVSGINVASNTPSTLHADSVLVVGDIGPASLEIDSGGRVESQRGQVTSFIPQTVSEVKIVGSNSSWVIQDDLTVGVNPSLSSNSGQAMVTLVDGYLKADSIYVDAGGIVRGSGTLAVAPANRFTNANGTISPGLSPGTITISGSFQQLAGGRLLMDIGGTNYADNDHLIITNAAALDGTITFRFLNGFAPKQGQQFDVLSVGGTLTGSFATVGIENLAPGFQFGLVTNGPALSLVASNDGVFSAALPGEVDVTVTNLGGITYANYIITTSNSCQTITLDGPFTQTGNAFTQTVSGVSFIRSDCADGILTVTNTLLLGALAPGDYSLSTISAGQTMNTLAFTVPPGGGQTLLMPTILADGSIQFQVAGPQSSLHCTIQASPDLKTWLDLATGTLPFTFTDPDAALYSQRYYRAMIGP
jgi:hypothetical protein